VLEKVGLAEDRRVVVAGVEVVRYVVRTPPAIGG
jgi:hypothetical protein